MVYLFTKEKSKFLIYDCSRTGRMDYKEDGIIVEILA